MEMRSVSFVVGLGVALVGCLSACGASPQPPSKVAIRVPPAPVALPESITPEEACRRLVGANERLLARTEASRVEALEKERAENPRATLPAKPEPMDRDGLDRVTGKEACIAADGVAWAYSLESYEVSGWLNHADVRIGIRFMGKNGKATPALRRVVNTPIDIWVTSTDKLESQGRSMAGLAY
ncbi:hypothetical protein LZC95_48390 [Pendulispora brunnea]|uniref:Uncharacterized protein n=1 Tax=Pendulispora brunnea TaxID=2905690 RepID=A0ABZ2KBJ3_9BACT